MLKQGLVNQAYEQEKEEGVRANESLLNNFGPADTLIGKQLIIGAAKIKKAPRLTLAFIKLGTFSLKSDPSNSNDYIPPLSKDPVGDLGF